MSFSNELQTPYPFDGMSASIGSEPFVLLDDARPGGVARLYRHPVAVVAAHAIDDAGRALGRLRQARTEGLHAAGFLSYAARAAFEPRLGGATGDSEPARHLQHTDPRLLVEQGKQAEQPLSERTPQDEVEKAVTLNGPKTERSARLSDRQLAEPARAQMIKC